MAETNKIYFSRHIVCDDLTRLIKEFLPQEINLQAPVQYAKGAYVRRQVDQADSIFFLRQGQIVVKIEDAKDTR